jgi:thiosulfate dehydrogenase
MRRVLLGTALVVLAIAPAAAQPRPPAANTQAPAPAAPQPAASAASAEQGQGIAEQGTSAGALPCAQCHGMNGAGNGADAFPRLDGQSAYYLFKQLNDYASGARENPIMGPIAQSLSEAERQDVSAYYGALRFAGPVQTSAPAPQMDQQAARAGRTIVEVGVAERGVQGCVNCHGPQAMGLAPTTPRLAGQWASYTRAQFEAFRNGTRKNDVAAVMRDLSSRLNDDDVAAISNYLEAPQ